MCGHLSGSKSSLQSTLLPDGWQGHIALTLSRITHLSFSDICIWAKKCRMALESTLQTVLNVKLCYFEKWLTITEVCSEGEVGARSEEHNKGNCFSLEQPPMQEFQEALISCVIYVFAHAFCSV